LYKEVEIPKAEELSTAVSHASSKPLPRKLGRGAEEGHGHAKVRLCRARVPLEWSCRAIHLSWGWQETVSGDRRESQCEWLVVLRRGGWHWELMMLVQQVTAGGSLFPSANSDFFS